MEGSIGRAVARQSRRSLTRGPVVELGSSSSQAVPGPS